MNNSDTKKYTSPSFYEKHYYKDPSFPIIFHHDFLIKGISFFIPHLHKNIEMLYMTSGKAIVRINQVDYNVKQGDLVIINSEQLHKITLVGDKASYYCFLIDKSLYSDVNDFFQPIVNDKIVKQYLSLLLDELIKERFNYKNISKNLISSLFFYLQRNYRITDKENIFNNTGNKKIELTKSIVNYIDNNYMNEISTKNISKQLGFTESYLCHVFKEITNQTIIDYINFVRCSNAQKLLLTGIYTVYQSAIMCGFNSMPYFSKKYKKFFGTLPSKEKI